MDFFNAGMELSLFLQPSHVPIGWGFWLVILCLFPESSTGVGLVKALLMHILQAILRPHRSIMPLKQGYYVKG